MARITVEDCLEHVDNRFDLVLLATKRARQIAGGVDPLIPWENDKPTVVALREIAAGLITEQVIDDQDKQEDASEDELLIALGEELAELQSGGN